LYKDSTKSSVGEVFGGCGGGRRVGEVVESMGVEWGGEGW